MNTPHALLMQLAEERHRAPIGTHLILHRHPEVEQILLDGGRLGEVIAETASYFSTPLAVPLMDLTLEKEALLLGLGVEPTKVEGFHFTEPPANRTLPGLTPRMQAACEAIRHVAARPTMLPMGMGIGPFSLMTKLIADPITPVFLAGTGASPEEEPEVAVVEAAIAAGLEIILGYMDAQIDAGARAFILCEPAANQVYFSPNQLEQSYEVFDRLVMSPLRRIKAHMDARNVALVFHDCGELNDGMISRFASLDAAMISLGSSRDLARDSSLIPRTTVLYGNLPTKNFISPQLRAEDVRRLGREISERMAATEHPFILGSECDVLSVAGKEQEIMEKVEAFLQS